MACYRILSQLASVVSSRKEPSQICWHLLSSCNKQGINICKQKITLMHHMEFFHTLLWLLQKYLPCDIFHEGADKSAGGRQPWNTATVVEKQLMIISFPHHYGCHFLPIIIIIFSSWLRHSCYFLKIRSFHLY